MNDDAYCVLMRIIGRRRDKINCLKTSKYREIVYQPLLSPGPRFGSLLRSPKPIFLVGMGVTAPSQEPHSRYRPFAPQSAKLIFRQLAPSECKFW